MSTIKLNADFVCLGHLYMELVLPGHNKTPCPLSSQSEQVYYCNHVINDKYCDFPCTIFSGLESGNAIYLKIMCFMLIIFLLGPGILKKSSTSLQPVPEFAESKIQRADSNLETVESEVHYFYSICNVQSHFYSTSYST